MGRELFIGSDDLLKYSVALEIEILRPEALEDGKHSFIVEEYRSPDQRSASAVVGKRLFQADVCRLNYE